MIGLPHNLNDEWIDHILEKDPNHTCFSSLEQDLAREVRKLRESQTIKLARKQGYRNGYTQAIADMSELISEVMRHLSENFEVEGYHSRMESLKHVRALLNSRAKKFKDKP